MVSQWRLSDGIRVLIVLICAAVFGFTCLTSLRTRVHFRKDDPIATSTPVPSWMAGVDFGDYAFHPVEQPVPLPATKDELAPVVITMVMFGNTSTLEGLGALKSVLMYLSRPLELHLVCSEEVPGLVDAKFGLISRPAYNIRVNYYVLDEDSIRSRAARAGISTKHQAGWGGLAKVFLHEILFTVRRVIYFDTDMAFLVDPYLLWREFDRLSGEKMISFPIQDPEADAWKICTCVMLLDLQAMRRSLFMPSTAFPSSSMTLGSPETWRRSNLDPLNPTLGDQGLYWAVWRRYPQYVEPLALSWDITHCHFSWGLGLAQGDESITEAEHVLLQTETNTSPRRFDQIFPGILHFNCEGPGVVWDDADNLRRPRWAPYVHIIRQYKWVWFNRGDGEATVDTTIVDAHRFHDSIMFASPPDSPGIVHPHMGKGHVAGMGKHRQKPQPL